MRLKHWLIGLVWLLNAGLAQAQLDAASAESLLRKSGLWEQLASIGPQVVAGMRSSIDQSPTPPSPAEADRLAGVLGKAHAADRLRRRALETFMRGGTPEHLPALLGWFATPLGQRITALEEAAAASTQEPQATVRAGVALLEKSEAQRRALLEDLVRSTRAAEGLVQMTIATTMAMQRGLASAMPEQPGPAPAELRAMLEAQRPQMEQAFAALTLAGSALAYADLSTPELATYVAFIKSPAGQHLNDLGLQAFNDAMTEAAAEAGRGMPATKDGANT